MGKFRLVDISSGIGGMCLGFMAAGDYDLLCAIPRGRLQRKVFHENLPKVKTVSEDPDVDEIPHPDIITAQITRTTKLKTVISIIKAIRPRALAMELPSQDAAWIGPLGYTAYVERLDASDFGLPQKRRRWYAAAFRNDIKPAYMTFGFPDPLPGRGTLGDIFEQHPDETGLRLSRRAVEYRERRSEKNKLLGVRFAARVLGPADTCPAITERYSRDRNDIVVDSGSGQRYLSLTEIKRVMGFPDGFWLPGDVRIRAIHPLDRCRVSQWQTRRATKLLSEAVCPPVAKALAGELKDWIFKLV